MPDASFLRVSTGNPDQDLADMLLADIRKAVTHFEEQAGRAPKAPAPQFKH